MVNPEVIRNVLGIIGNVISFGLFLSPVPTFYHIIKKRSVEKFKPDPYIMTLLNCAMWVLYGMPFVHPNNLLVVTINGVGLVIEFIYIACFLFNSPASKKKKIGIALLIEAIFFAAVFAITFKGFHKIKQRTNFVGVLCVIFNIGMYYSPLTVMGQVIKTKSVKYMPFWLSLTSFLNGSVWTAYALIDFDPWMVIPNGLGAVGGAVQLIIYAIYYQTTDWSEEKKPAEVEFPA